MRTLLTGELAQGQSFDSDYFVKLEIQNADGTWIDVGAALGTAWIVNATWGETVDAKVSEATFTLVQQIGTASLSPLMAASPLNVDDLGAYAPLLDIGRLVRASTATMLHGTTLDVAKYREIFTGRVDAVEQADGMNAIMAITLRCSDLGAWLMDLQIETSGVQYGTTPVGTALETVIQNILTANIPSDEPAVTLYKQSASSFAVTDWLQGDTKLLEALTTIVLDSTGDDLRYRYDAAHASRLTWFNPDRTRVTVDATFSPRQYVLRQLDLAIANIRNAGEMTYVGGVAISESVPSRQKYRRRFFRLPSSAMITTALEAQTVIDAVVNDLSAPPGEAAADCPYLWFVQLYDRYTFQANARQFDSDQTFAVMGYQHTIENGRGATTLTLTARVVGAYGEWLARIRNAKAEVLGELGNVQWEVVAGITTVTFEQNARTAEVWAAAALAPLAESPDWDALALTTLPLPIGTTSLVVPTPADGQVTLVQLEPRHADLTAGLVRRLLITATPQVPTAECDDLETATTGTQWIQLTERGIPITLVEVQTQVGAGLASPWTPPSRGPGSTSLVRGGALGPLAYEHDVPLDASRQSWITFRYTLANGQQIVMIPFGFDRNKNPNLGPVTVAGTLVTVVGDVDTKSVTCASKTRAWSWTKDGVFATFDVAKADPSGHAGLGAASPGTNSATGGTITDVGGYRYHTFTADGTFVLTSGTDPVDVLVVGGGGGGGGGGLASGGGAGRMVERTAWTLAPGSFSVVIAGGGSGGSGPTSLGQTNGTDGGAGSDSTFNGITAKGGGAGRHYTGTPGTAGGTGGSGGGGSPYDSTTHGAGGTASDTNTGGGTSYGNTGGAGDAYSGGAGGGAGGVGGAGQSFDSPSTAGIGRASVVDGVTYAKGGRGAYSALTFTTVANSGNGGDAGGGTATGQAGAAGKVVIRYPLGTASAGYDTFTAKANSDPASYLSGATLTDARDVVVANGSPSISAKWADVEVLAPSIGSADVSILLRATAAPAGWTVELWFGTAVFAGSPAQVNHTADVSPTLSAPPTALTAYAYTTLFPAADEGGFVKTVKLVGRADLKDNTGVVVDTLSLSATWFTTGP